MVSLLRYSIASTSIFLFVVCHAFHTRGQFYPAMVYLSTSKFSLVALGNMFIFLLVLASSILQKLFLGTLREVEVERLHELSRHELMETALAMTIFREEFDAYFAAMFAVLMTVKILHWLCQKRVEYIETTPSISWFTHLRIFLLMSLLLGIDVLFFRDAVLYIIQQKAASVRLLFAFEFLILATTTMVSMIKYCLYAADMVMEGQWDNKAVYIFYLEFVRDILHLTAYTVFFLIIFRFYGLPLHLMRDLYETFRNFRTRVADFLRYRRLTSNLNERFTDATPEELARGDSTCIICREEMSTAKKLPCGHMFHVHCLRSWLERQQTCPTCRAPLLENPRTDTAANQQQEAEVGVGNINFIAQRFFGIGQNQQIPAFGPNAQNWAQYYRPAFGNPANQQQAYDQNLLHQNQVQAQIQQQMQALHYHNQLRTQQNYNLMLQFHHYYHQFIQRLYLQQQLLNQHLQQQQSEDQRQQQQQQQQQQQPEEHHQQQNVNNIDRNLLNVQNLNPSFSRILEYYQNQNPLLAQSLPPQNTSMQQVLQQLNSTFNSSNANPLSVSSSTSTSTSSTSASTSASASTFPSSTQPSPNFSSPSPITSQFPSAFNRPTEASTATNFTSFPPGAASSQFSFPQTYPFVAPAPVAGEAHSREVERLRALAQFHSQISHALYSQLSMAPYMHGNSFPPNFSSMAGLSSGSHGGIGSNNVNNNNNTSFSTFFASSPSFFPSTSPSSLGSHSLSQTSSHTHNEEDPNSR